jgi:hypothetical protein
MIAIDHLLLVALFPLGLSMTMSRVAAGKERRNLHEQVGCVGLLRHAPDNAAPRNRVGQANEHGSACWNHSLNQTIDRTGEAVGSDFYQTIGSVGSLSGV